MSCLYNCTNVQRICICMEGALCLLPNKMRKRSGISSSKQNRHRCPCGTVVKWFQSVWQLHIAHIVAWYAYPYMPMFMQMTIECRSSIVTLLVRSAHIAKLLHKNVCFYFSSECVELFSVFHHTWTTWTHERFRNIDLKLSTTTVILFQSAHTCGMYCAATQRCCRINSFTIKFEKVGKTVHLRP